jgi:hypothetical protein
MDHAPRHEVAALEPVPRVLTTFGPDSARDCNVFADLPERCAGGLGAAVVWFSALDRDIG